MITFRKIIPLFAGAAAALTPFIASAADPKGENVKTIVQNIVSVAGLLITLMMILSIVVLGWGIIRLIIAAGNPDAVKKAKGVIIWGIIGIAVFVSLFGLIEFIKTYFGITETGALKPPEVK